MLHEYWRPFGNCDFRVSPLGLGTVKLGRNQQVKYPSEFELPDDKQVSDLLVQAQNLGINLIDTAPAYGNSEMRLGHHLKGQRPEWVIVSKVGEEFIDGQSYFNFTPEHIVFSIKRSLQRLQTDFIDVVMVHSDGNDLDIINRIGALDVLNDLKSQGFIRATGMSIKTIDGGIAALKNSDSVMATFSSHAQEEKPVLQFAHEHNKGVLIKKALASGRACFGAAGQNSDDPVADSFATVFSNPGVSSIVIGTINEKHLRHNANACQAVLQAQLVN